MKLANRLDNFDANLGTAMNLLLTMMKAEGKDVINLGLGDQSRKLVSAWLPALTPGPVEKPQATTSRDD